MNSLLERTRPDMKLRSGPQASQRGVDPSHMQADAAFFVALLGRVEPSLALHSLRVAELVRGFVRHILMTEALQDEFHAIALFHDIGRLGSQGQALLGSPGTGEAVDGGEEDRAHPAEGARLIRLLPDLSRGAVWIQHHHERFDGKGFPAGLRENSIPLGSRILSIPEAYDGALFAVGGSPEAALELVRAGAGRLFDPQLADEFVKFMGPECPRDLARKL